MRRLRLLALCSLLFAACAAERGAGIGSSSSALTAAEPVYAQRAALIPDDAGDWSRVFDRILASPACASSGVAGEHRGCRIELPLGRIPMSRGVVFDRVVVLEGQGSRGPNTEIVLARGSLTFANGSDGSVMRGIAVRSVGTSTAPPILMHARAWLADVQAIDSRGVGIRIESGPSVPNVNGWLFEWVQVSRARSDGVLLTGANANAGLALSLNVKQACWGAVKTSTCAGVRDESWLGNTYVAPMVHTTRNATAKLGAHPAYRLVSDNASGLLVNPYAEFDNAPDMIFRPNVRLFGIGRTAPGSTGMIVRLDSALLRASTPDGLGSWFRTDRRNELFLGPHRIKLGVGPTLPPLPDLVWPEGSEFLLERAMIGFPDRFRLIAGRWRGVGQVGP